MIERSGTSTRMAFMANKINGKDFCPGGNELHDVSWDG